MKGFVRLYRQQPILHSGSPCYACPLDCPIFSFTIISPSSLHCLQYCCFLSFLPLCCSWLTLSVHLTHVFFCFVSSVFPSSQYTCRNCRNGMSMCTHTHLGLITAQSAKAPGRHCRFAHAQSAPYLSIPLKFLLNY